MGVTGLWTVVQPCARPIKLETLNKKRLAVDASIWIYQFLKAVRDKEGNALRNSHVVGFFRRICKLLFFGIKPVFVFDGGAPILKRQTVSGRKARREGRREDAVRTAGKLLAVQMQRRAEEDDRKRRDERQRPAQDEEEPVPENLVYVDELQMTEQEKLRSRTFKKKDQYHLPNLDVDLADMGAPNDPRIMSHEELEEYARQFHTGEDVNVYDFSKIDFESPFFLSLPASDRYNILNAARLRSRLRMGHSKEQLDDMFPNRMDFSRFQIQRVKERNELTQRLMNINGMNGEDAMFGINNPGRVAGERGKEYVLVKNDGVEGGWALGVVSNRGEGERSNPVDVEHLDQPDFLDEAEDDAWEDDGFEDVPIEGLNRLPKRATGAASENTPFASDELEKRRRAVYEARMEAAGLSTQDGGEGEEEADSLFVPQTGTHATDDNENDDDLFEDVPPPQEEEDEDLNRAIAMSLEQQEEDAEQTEPPTLAASAKSGPRIDRPLDFNQKNAKAGRDAAHLINSRAHGFAPKPFAEESDEEDNLNLKAALEESRRSKHKPHSGPRVQDFKKPAGQAKRLAEPSSAPLTRPTGHVTFDGPLPFESLSLGKSILGQKKKKPAEEEAGGFEKDAEKEKPAQPLPPWFSGDIREEAAKQKAIEQSQFEGGTPDRRAPSLQEAAKLRRQETGEVIDLDAPKLVSKEVIVVDDDQDDEDDEDNGDDVVIDKPKPMPVDSEVRMDDIADFTRVEPPVSDMPNGHLQSPNDQRSAPQEAVPTIFEKSADSDEEIEWSESDHEDMVAKRPTATEVEVPAGGQLQKEATKSSSPEFENVGTIGSPTQPQSPSPILEDEEEDDRQPMPSPPRGQSMDGQFLEDINNEDGDFSDPEDEELMRQMAVEAEEHARFASTLNSKSQLQNAEDYEKELRQLRNQQKKDRRDADEVTHIMVTECQQLLSLFGLPYITAPMEAEAQCAELVSLGLVDGIVTDDSDIFLFGGTRVYKNMFNQSKFVECYVASDLEKEYALDRQKLIRFAHLLGSDYTEGLPSVGPVTALEILSEFDTLEDFSDWFSTIQLGQHLAPEDQGNAFRRKFRKNAAKIFLPNPFPDTRVDLAYLHPEVDTDPQPFAWGVPDLDRLRSFLMATIGWSQERTDEVLVPVIKDMNRRENEGTQANITQFFQGGVGIGGRESAQQGSAPRRRVQGKSQRMENALGRLHERARERTMGEVEGTNGNENAGELAADDAAFDDADGVPVQETVKEKPRKSKARAKKRTAEESGLSEDSANEDDEYRAATKSRKTAQGASKGRRKTTKSKV